MNEEEKTVSLYAIAFQEVSFSIGNRTILEDVNFQLQPGAVTGMTAPSGKGKTTLINLLLGFLEISSGQILFNDVVVSANERKKFWSRISYVKQQPFVLHDSLEQNIRLAANASNSEVETVMRITQMQHWLQEDAAATSITEGGKNISGGQQQRIALARALHKDADCYILDEPFHALDATATNQLIDHLETLAEAGKMILLISHDQHTIQRCRQIITLS